MVHINCRFLVGSGQIEATGLVDAPIKLSGLELLGCPDTGQLGFFSGDHRPLLGLPLAQALKRPNPPGRPTSSPRFPVGLGKRGGR